ncbi:MAG: hypothetical protein KDC79_07800 [Cyclobacteriaceae bacterium]|nr:hypothetical protein [Cyclobacteriaceae bacterium]
MKTLSILLLTLGTALILLASAFFILGHTELEKYMPRNFVLIGALILLAASRYLKNKFVNED